MTSERGVRGFAGLFVLAGLALTATHDRNWVYFTMLVGTVLMQSGITDRCPLRWLLEKAGLPRCAPTSRPGISGNPSALINSTMKGSIR